MDTPLIERWSQSLFIQGWGTTLGDDVKKYAALSQSLFIQGWGTTSAFALFVILEMCLNPFSFRAGVLLLLHW